MSKEYIEALNVIKNIKLSHVETEEDEDFDGNWVYDTIEVDDGSIKDKYPKQIKILKQALQRLEAIDNASPGEALECLKRLDNMEFYRSIKTFIPEIASYICETQYLDNTNEFYAIKQSLLKAQEQEKMLDDNLIFENGHIMSGFSYKGKDVVAMPLNEYDRLMGQEEVLEILFEKKVDIEYLSKCNDVKEYNAHWCDERFYLTQEGFDLLKSWLDNRKKE